MAQTIELPHVGESVVEGTIGKWLKKPGDKIERYEPLVEVVTDKVTMEVPSPVDGSLVRILAQEGETIPMGAPIAEVEVAGSAPDARPAAAPGAAPGAVAASAPAPELTAMAGETSAAPAASTGATAPAPVSPSLIGYLNTSATMVGPTGAGSGDDSPPDAPPHPSESATQTAVQSGPAAPASVPPGQSAPAGATTPVGSSNGTPRLSPAVRRLAREHGLDLSGIRGTGMGGRITRDDVLRYLESGNLESIESAAESAAASASASEMEAKPAADEEYVPLTPVRRMIAEAMVRSVSQIPHAWSTVEVDVTGLVAARAARREAFRQREGVDLTYLPFVIRILVESLKENPTFNASWGGDKIILKKRLNIGLAVAAPSGLVVPVIHDADRLSLSALAHAVADLTQRARQNKLTLSDVQGGTFTLNNTGALGSTVSQPIINYPQAAIMTTEAIQKRPVVINDAIAIRSMMNLCLSFDHRINDGAESSAFIQSVKRRLESISPDVDFG